MATDLVQTGPVPDWVNAMLGPVVYPIYNRFTRAVFNRFRRDRVAPYGVSE